MNHVHIKHIKIWHIMKLIDQIYPSGVFSLKTWNIENNLSWNIHNCHHCWFPTLKFVSRPPDEKIERLTKVSSPKSKLLVTDNPSFPVSGLFLLKGQDLEN